MPWERVHYPAKVRDTKVLFRGGGDFCSSSSIFSYHLSERRYNSRYAIGSAVYQCLMGVPIEEYEKCFQKLIDQLKRCVLAGGEYFEGQSKLK